MMLSVVASGVFFTYYYDPTFGILSYVINNITGDQFILMDNKMGAGRGIVFADAWMWSPFVMLLVLAGLVAPKYLYEAAAIDRVSAWRRFWTITFPYIRRLLMLALLFRTIEAFKLADLRDPAHQGRQRHDDDLLPPDPHRQRAEQDSEGAAISYLMLFMVIVLTNLSLPRRSQDQEGWASHDQPASFWQSGWIPLASAASRRRVGVARLRRGDCQLCTISCRCSSSSSPRSSAQALALSVPPTLSPTSFSVSSPNSSSSRRHWTTLPRSFPA